IGQVEEEGIGIDLTEPLPIEKSNKEVGISDTAQTAVDMGAIAPQDAGLFEKNTLSDSDVTMGNVATLQLSPQLLAMIPPLREGEEFHFGENEKEENQRDAILGEALSSQLLGNGNGAGVGVLAPTNTTEANGGGTTTASAGADPALMTPE